MCNLDLAKTDASPENVISNAPKLTSRLLGQTRTLAFYTTFYSFCGRFSDLFFRTWCSVVFKFLLCHVTFAGGVFAILFNPFASRLKKPGHKKVKCLRFYAFFKGALAIANLAYLFLQETGKNKKAKLPTLKRKWRGAQQFSAPGIGGM